LIQLFFGSEYLGADEPLKALSITGAAWLISTPLLLGVYPINKPIVLAQGDLIKLVLHIVAYAILVAPYGIMGAAWGSALALGSGSIIAVALVLNVVRKAEEVFPSDSTSNRQGNP
jgi:O-antigen/teichoic acid export membrane protein